MSDRYEVYLADQEVPTAMNVQEAYAEDVDFNLEVLTNLQAHSVRQNPASSVAEVDAEIRDLLDGNTPTSLKAAKKIVSGLGLDRVAAAQVVDALKGLYVERDALLAESFSVAIADTLTANLSKNQKFFADAGLIQKMIVTQSSQYRDHMHLGGRATFSGLPPKLQDFTINLVMFLEPFVSVEEDGSEFNDMSFFKALASLTRPQLDAIFGVVNKADFQNAAGAHYAPYITLSLQALATINPEGFLSALETVEIEESSTFSNISELLGRVGFQDSAGNRVTAQDFSQIATDMQGTGVDSEVVNLSLKALIGDGGVMGDARLRQTLVTATALSPDDSLPSSQLMQVFLFAKALNVAFPDLEGRKSLFGTAFSQKTAGKAFSILKKQIKTPPSMSADYIFDNYVAITGNAAAGDIHYLEWGFSLYGAYFKEGSSNYNSDSKFENDKKACIHFGSDAGARDLQTLIDLLPRIKDHLESSWGGNVGGPSKSSPTPIGVPEGLSSNETRVFKYFTDLSHQCVSKNLLLAAAQVKDPYDLAQFRYELVPSTVLTDGVAAISVPLNPLEQLSGYRSLGSCCMKPFNVGTLASMTSFFGVENMSGTPFAQRKVDPKRSVTVYAFKYNTVTKNNSEPRTVCLGTLYAPMFLTTYKSPPSTSPNPSIELLAGPTKISLKTQGVVQPYPSEARSFDGWEAVDSAYGIPAEDVALGADVVVEGLMGSSLAKQMGLLGSVGTSTLVTKDPTVEVGTTLLPTGTYIDYRSPSATAVLRGELEILNPSLFFKSLTISALKSGMFKLEYKGKDKSTPDLSVDASPEYLQYVLSFPMFSKFVPLEGALEFVASDGEGVDAFYDMYLPAWFDGCDERPLTRGDKKLRKADILAMRTPAKGVTIRKGGGRAVDMLKRV